MKHEWKIHYPSTSTAYLFKGAVCKRTCIHCGKTQYKNSQQIWGRIDGYHWTPLIGRCNQKENMPHVVVATNHANLNSVEGIYLAPKGMSAKKAEKLVEDSFAIGTDQNEVERFLYGQGIKPIRFSTVDVS